MLKKIDTLGYGRLVTVVGAALLSGVIFTQSATAALVANYDFETNFDVSSSVTGVFGSTPGDVSFGAGLSAVSSGVGVPSRSVQIDLALAADLAGAITGDDFLTFTVTPDAGTPLNLTELRFSSQRNLPNVANAWTVFASTDATIGTQVGAGALAVETAGVDFEPETADLFDDAFLQNLSSAVTFRIFFSGFTAGPGGDTFRVDALQLDGVAASVIPEPSSLVLMTSLLMGSVMGRRRR